MRVFPCVFSGEDLALGAAITKPARDKDAIHTAKMFFGTFLFDDFRIDALNNNPGVMCGTRVCQGFVNRLIGVLQFNVLADNCNFQPRGSG